jgi:hypothetical protein
MRNGDETGIDCGGSCVDDCGCDSVAIVMSSIGGATSWTFANDDVVGHLDQITAAEFNALMASGAAALRHNYAVVVVSCCADEPVTLDWTSNVLPYLAHGGSLIIELVANALTQLSPGIVTVDTTAYSDPVNVVPSATYAILLLL